MSGGERALFSGDGEMAARLRAFDWDGHPLGAPTSWPAELRSSLTLCMRSQVPTAIYWGPELRLLYNDAWAPIPAERHPWALGRPAAEVWSDIWDVVGPQFDEVMRTGRGYQAFDQLLHMERRGAPRETYWNYSFTPIVSETGDVLGVFNQGHETTDRVLTAQLQAFRLEINDRLRDLSDGEFSASAVLGIVLGAIGSRLGLARAGYASVDPDRTTCTVIGNWREDRVEDIAAGRYRLADFGEPIVTDMLAGGVVATEDVAAEPRNTPEVAASFEAIGVRANLVAPVVRGGRAIAFLFLNDDRPRAWTRHEIDLARDVADRIWTSLARAETNAKLRESEARFSAIFGQAAVGLAEVDQKGRYIRFNESMARILGRPLEDAPSLTVADVTHPDDLAVTRLRLAEAVERNGAYELEKRYMRPDGTAVWAVTNVTRLVDEAGRPGGFFSVTTDVTERKEQERIRAWLLAELNHRVKNNLSTVQALAYQTKVSTAPEDFQEVFDARLMALSRAHDLLMRETWTSAALADLVSATLAPFRIEETGRISVAGPEIRLSPTAAVTMTLAFHELATNSAKFGALSRPEGRIEVGWSVASASAGSGTLDLHWRESNGPIVAPPLRRGFGSRLIERGAARELGGTVRLDFEPDGVACAFHLPLSQKIMAP